MTQPGDDASLSDAATTASTVDEVRYPLSQFVEGTKTGRRVMTAVIVLALAAGAWNLGRGRVPLFPMLCLGFAAFRYWRVRQRGRDAVATRTGISGPHLRRPIQWSDVAQLEEPLRYDPDIYVTMRDGSRKHTGFPPSYFDALRSLTNVPIKPKNT